MGDAEEESRGLEGHRVFLRPLTPRDYERLYLQELSLDLGPRWRHQGATPSLESFTQSLWAGVLAQYLVVERETRRPIGLVCAYNANFIDGWAYFAVAKFGEAGGAGRIFHGLALFLSHLFRNWSFHKLYAEVAGHTLPSFSSALGRLVEEEGRLTDHEWYQGRRWDHHILALTRERWQRWAPIIMRHAVRGEKYRQEGPDFRPSRDWPDVA